MKLKTVIFSITLCLFCSFTICAQAYDTNVNFMKGNQSAVNIELNYPEETVEKAISAKLAKSGYNE